MCVCRGGRGAGEGRGGEGDLQVLAWAHTHLGAELSLATLPGQ